ncbi:MAG: hypothetical protein IKO20_09430 [Bacteroidaceae bacterium]|nr:hypothetical protein [Bacteroidaceae bacterium]
MPKIVFTEEKREELKRLYPHFDNKTLAARYGTTHKYIRQLANTLWVGVHKSKEHKRAIQRNNLAKGSLIKSLRRLPLKQTITERLLKAGDTFIAFVASERECSTLRVFIHRWNKQNQFAKGFRIHVEHFADTDYIIFIAEPLRPQDYETTTTPEH